MICPSYPDPQYLIISDQVPALLYYSHIPTIIIALLFGFFVYLKNKNSLLNKLLFLISIAFFWWTFFDLIAWTTNTSENSLFVWSLLGISYSLLYILSFYFVYVFITKEDLPFKIKIILGVLFLPVILLTPTRYNLSGFDLTLCGAAGFEGVYFTNYYYWLGLFIFLWSMVLSIRRYRNETDQGNKKRILWMTVGVGLFLLSFFIASFLASFLVWIGASNNYIPTQYGLFGMAVFLGFLAYLIVRYKAFNIKLIATQALVIALVILVGSMAFVNDILTIRIIIVVTLLLVGIVGINLIRSVKQEVKRKEQLQSLSDQLSVANDKLRALDKAKSEFISIASHQLRTPLTSIKGFGSLLLEGTYGEVPEAQRGALEKIYISNERLIQLVEDLLNISRIEAGRMEFDFQEAAIEDLVQEAAQTLELSAKAKNLYLHWEKPAVAMPKLKIDITKIKEVISNMIDNAIKYTQKGGITVRLDKSMTWDTDHKEHKDFVRVIVSDTGIGMDAEEIEMIFQKFQRGKQVAHYHTDGTGLGMYIGKKIVAEHKGRIWAESDGKGKGSRFILELPVN